MDVFLITPKISHAMAATLDLFFIWSNRVRLIIPLDDKNPRYRHWNHAYFKYNRRLHNLSIVFTATELQYIAMIFSMSGKLYPLKDDILIVVQLFPQVKWLSMDYFVVIAHGVIICSGGISRVWDWKCGHAIYDSMKSEAMLTVYYYWIVFFFIIKVSHLQKSVFIVYFIMILRRGVRRFVYRIYLKIVMRVSTGWGFCKKIATFFHLHSLAQNQYKKVHMSWLWNDCDLWSRKQYSIHDANDYRCLVIATIFLLDTKCKR